MQQQTRIDTPSFWIDAQSGEARMSAEQLMTWLKDMHDRMEAVQGILERQIECTFLAALQHMVSGGIAECQGLAYRIKDGELQCMREYDEPIMMAWTTAAEQTVYWALHQQWTICL